MVQMNFKQGGINNMKMTAILEGLKLKNSSYYENRENSDVLILSDGTEISFDCFENDGPNDCYNYADWSALEDTGFFEDTTITADTLKIDACDYGVRINGYFVPCYSCQNGYYTSAIEIIATKDGKEIARVNTYCEG